jgi:hypothetical protein
MARVTGWTCELRSLAGFEDMGIEELIGCDVVRYGKTGSADCAYHDIALVK